MLVLSATICLLSDPLTVECRTVAIRVAMDAADCEADLQPMYDFLRGQMADWPVAYLAVGCKAGVLG